MMVAKCMLVLFAVIVFESVVSKKISEDVIIENIPLTKSLGFSIRENFGKNLESSRIGQEYMELYNEMVKASQESARMSDAEDLEFATDLTRLKRTRDRRRSARMLSDFGRRRARSEASRREKLNSQSLRSHRAHSKHGRRNQLGTDLD